MTAHTDAVEALQRLQQAVVDTLDDEDAIAAVAEDAEIVRARLDLLSTERARQLAESKLKIAEKMVGGSLLIAVERRRQVEAEGYDADHDAQHEHALIRAAQCYTMSALLARAGIMQHRRPDLWPWAEEFWKPTDDPVRDLTKAGALLAAALDAIIAERAGS